MATFPKSRHTKTFRFAGLTGSFRPEAAITTRFKQTAHESSLLNRRVGMLFDDSSIILARDGVLAHQRDVDFVPVSVLRIAIK